MNWQPARLGLGADCLQRTGIGSESRSINATNRDLRLPAATRSFRWSKRRITSPSQRFVWQIPSSLLIWWWQVVNSTVWSAVRVNELGPPTGVGVRSSPCS